MSKSARKRAAEAAFKVRMDKLRDSGFHISIAGNQLVPGTREYEREYEKALLRICQELTPVELDDLSESALMPKGPSGRTAPG